ncbi:hypothetical protein OG21DRAFT_1490029 [Imleria badia]|nr:hypothetical protein OG21DRAFT_1490029 [Imleria badia]
MDPLIIYESEDDNIKDRVKQNLGRLQTMHPQLSLMDLTCDALSVLGKMKGSKQPLRINVATQDEDINPMAQSSQVVYECTSYRRQVSFNGEITSKTQEQPALAPLRPKFIWVAPGQSFSFRILDAISQLESNIQAPTYTQLQPSSKGSAPPSAYSCSLFLGGRRSSTTATSYAPSVCSSSGEGHL